MSILTVGTVAFDTIETPYGKVEYVVGGASLYASWAATFFADNVYMISIIGEDFPAEELEALEKRGAITTGIEKVAGGKSFYWSGKYLDDMISRETLVTDLNVLADFNPVIPEEAKSAEYVLLGNLTPAVQSAVLDQLEGNQKLIVLDTMNFWIDIAREELDSVIARVDLLTINDEEARMLSDERSLMKAAEKIMKMGPKYLIIKKGEHGAMLFHKDEIFYVPAMPIPDVIDPTGAGDTFAGGMLGYIAKQDKVDFETIKTGIVYGSATASYCVEDFSNEKLKSIATDEILDRVAKFKKLVSFEH